MHRAYLQLLSKERQAGKELLSLLRRAKNYTEITEINRKVRAWDKGIKQIARMAGMSSFFTELRYGPEIIPLDIDGEHFYEDLKSGTENDILERLAELDKMIAIMGEMIATKSEEGKPTYDAKRVFIIHGHNDALLERIARFLEKIELDAIILHEQPNEGKTIIEKLESSTNVGFAVALLTADDEGRAIGELDLKPRARQNVVFEAGFLMGRLGRNRVVLLYEPGVELPSDLHGLVYIKVDEEGAWKEMLFKELHSAGMNVSEKGWLGT